MPKNESALYLLTCYGVVEDGEQTQIERLVKAAKPTEAMRHAVGVKKATPEDVARVMQAGGRIEEAAS